MRRCLVVVVFWLPMTVVVVAVKPTGLAIYWRRQDGNKTISSVLSFGGAVADAGKLCRRDSKGEPRCRRQA
jgi:hypothetical protein